MPTHTFYFIRHAESEGNVNHHLIGGRSNHYPLTERGQEQARLLGLRLHEEALQFDQVFASVAIRATQTAQIACRELNLPLESITYSEQIVEQSQGDWEGQVRKDIYTPELKAELRANSYHFKGPNGESQQEVGKRMMGFVEELIGQLPAQDAQRVAIFSHGFAIRALCREILQWEPLMTYRSMLHNTSLTTLVRNNGHWYLERFNDFAHLAGREFVGHY